ncbi:MAG: hypothetical protein ACKPKO_45880, partial [Candidatus Fonsibacter sp.]
MMICSLRDTNVHIINRVGGSGTERRLREFLRSSGFMAQTGFIADNAHFCRARSGMRGKGVVFVSLILTHFVDDRVDCLTDIRTQTQGSAMLCLIPAMYASGHINRSYRDTTARNRDNLGRGRDRLLGFRFPLC